MCVTYVELTGLLAVDFACVFHVCSPPHIDPWYFRCGIAQAWTTIAPLWPAETATALFRFIIDVGVRDHDSRTQEAVMTAGTPPGVSLTTPTEWPRPSFLPRTVMFADVCSQLLTLCIKSRAPDTGAVARRLCLACVGDVLC